MSRGQIRPLTIETTRLTCATTACAATAYPGLRLSAKQNRGAAGKWGGGAKSLRTYVSAHSWQPRSWRERVEEKRCLMGQPLLEAHSA